MVQNIWGKLNRLDDQGILDALVWMGGNLVYVAPSGSDSNYGNSDSPVASLEEAYGRLRDGFNDAIVLAPDFLTGLSDAAASCTIRVNAAFSWNKSATHLIGLSPSIADIFISPRARLAPTSTTVAFANFFTIPLAVTGCLFRGIQWFHDFATDTTSQVAVTVTGCRNVFQRCHFAGGNNDDAGNRSLLLTSGASGNKGENLFEDCTIGIDTVDRAQASGLLGLAGTQVPRNWFRRCLFLSRATGANPRMILAGSQAIDRFIMFEECTFINHGTALTSLMTLNASQNGPVLMTNCARYNCGNFGDTANTLITGPVTVNTAGLGTAPAA